MRKYSKETGNCYLVGHHVQIPPDAIEIPEARYLEVIANPASGKIRSHDTDGLPILIDPPPHMPSADELCHQVDSAADLARLAVAGDPLRALEYQKAADEAQTFKDSGYPADAVPPMVASWAINGRTAQQAADSILVEATAYNDALYQLRETRLAAKEQIRTLMAVGKTAEAEKLAADTVAAIQTSVTGIGNASA